MLSAKGPLPVPAMMVPVLMLLIGGMLGTGVARAAPAEVPPPSYTAAQYVDSTGCVFYRRTATAEWEPRQTRDKRPLCGYDPTVIEAAPAAVAADAPPPMDRRAAPGLAARLAMLAAQPLSIVDARTIPGPLTACPGGPVMVQRYLLSDGRTVMRCGPQIDDPVGFINGAGVRGLRVAVSDVPDLPLPATAALLSALRGDLRAVPRHEPPQATTTTRARTTPARIAPGGDRYVQIGAFANAVNAEKVKARLRALGLPVSTGSARIGGKQVQVVYAGPLTGAEAQDALRDLRADGFRDAILR